MNAIVLGKVTQKGLILFCLFFLLLLIGGCGSSGGDNPSKNTNPGPDVDFSGDWNMHEELNGCNDSIVVDYPVKITQNGNSAQLELSEQNFIDCTIADNQLQCGGDFSLTNGGRIDYSEYTLWYKGDNLEGEGTWKLYDENDRYCSGTSVFSATPGTSDNGETPDFNGDWEIFEEQDGDGQYFQYRYTITIEQNGTQATLSKGNDYLTCNVFGEDLVCPGRFFYEEDESSCSFDPYRLRHDGNNGLTGVASWTITYQGRDYNGRSQLTTTQPEEGSIQISNHTDATFPLVNFRPCDSSDWGENRFSSDQTMEPNDTWYWSGIQQGCYDIRVCEEIDGSGCITGEDFTVNGGETSRISIDPNSSLRLNQKSIDPERFTGTMVREFESRIK